MFVGQKVMRHREAFDLKPLVVLWNMLLAAFSVAGALVVVPTVIGARMPDFSF